MSKQNGIGCKGGTSATSGRKAETVVVEFPGGEIRKRVFFGQRWAVVSQKDENSETRVSLFATQEEAQKVCDSIQSLGHLIHFVTLARATGQEAR